MEQHLEITLENNLDELNYILESQFYTELLALKQNILKKSDNKNENKNENNWKCNKCSYIARHSSNLTSHYRLIHTEEKPWKCSICNKRFGRSDYLVKHERCHTGEKPHLCTICNKRFIQRSVLTKHLKRVHNK